MKRDLLEILACTECAGALDASVTAESRGEIETGTLTCTSCGRSYPILRFVPRFVPPDNYAGNFGFQWNRFRRTQLDSNSGVPISRERLFRASGWMPEELTGKRVLDVGCGSGRFVEVALSCGARVVAVDFSSAVDACFENFGAHPRLNVVQADVYRLPFKLAQFDYVYCLGVLQHTPDVKKSFLSLPVQLKPGGKLTVDIYPKLWLNALWPKYWLRPLTKRMDPRRLFRLVERMVPLLLPISSAFSSVPVIGWKLRNVVPVANYARVFPQLTSEQVREWAVLDTFDMFGPVYDQPQSESTLRTWAVEAGLKNVEVFRRGQLIGRATR